MATRDTDVNLVIKARDESTRALNSITAALSKLANTSDQASTKAAGLASALQTADRVAGTIGAAADRSEAAFAKLGSRVAEQRAVLDTYRQRVRAARDELVALSVATNDPKDKQAEQTLRAKGEAYKLLTTEVKRLERELAVSERQSASASLAYREQKTAVAEIATAQARLRTEYAQTTRALNEQTEAARRLAAAQNIRRAATEAGGQPSFKSARLSAAVFQSAGLTDFERGQQAAAARAISDQAAAAERLRNSLNPLRGIQKQFNDEIREAIRLRRAEQISTDELRQRIQQVRALQQRAVVDIKRNGGGGQIGAFGLRPYELTNLGYQVNDLITQVASGTSVMQAFAQQGGQIIQIIPEIGSQFAAWARNPYLLAAAAILGTIVVGLRELREEVSRTKQIDSLLTFNVRADQFDSSAIERTADALQKVGMSASEATSAVNKLTQSGLDQGAFLEAGKTAQNMADVLGIEVPEALDQVIRAFTGGKDALLEYADKYAALSAEERKRIVDLIDSGNAEEARMIIFDRTKDNFQDAAEKARGPWSSAWRNLKAGFSEMADRLSDTAFIRFLAERLDWLGQKANNLATRFRNLWRSATPADQLATVEAQLAREPEQNMRNPSPRIQGLLDRRDQLRREVATPPPAERDRVTNSENVARRDREAAAAVAERRAREAEANANRAESEANRAAREAERAREERERNARDPIFQTAALLRQREGFRANAYYDVNAYRAGYGSDTVTRADGRVERVTAATTVTREEAERDLTRRIEEFRQGIERLIGSERFRQFSPTQQAALTSVAYNYGTLGRTRNGGGAGIADVVRTGTVEEIAAAIRGLAGNNGGVNRDRRNAEADMFNQPNVAVENDNLRRAERQQEQQDEFNQSLEVEYRRRQSNIDQANRERDLTGIALIDAQKQAFVEDAIRRDRERAQQQEVQYTEEQLARTRQLAEAEFEATRGVRERAEARRKEATDPVDRLTSRRDSISNQLENAQRNGDTNLTGRLQEQLTGINAELRTAIDNAITLLGTMSGPEAEAARLKMEEIRGSLGESGRQFLMTGKQINETLAGGIASAFDRFAQNVAEGKNVFKSLRDAFLQFASDFLRQIAQMIIKQLIFNAIGGPGGSGGSGGGLASIIGGLFHNGGVVGFGGGGHRPANPAWFANATRYHTGGIAGLAPNEVPAVLQRGEEVLTRTDPRHRMNGGGGGGAQTIKNVVVFDRESAAQELLRSPAGEKAILSILSENRQAAQAALSG